MARKREEKANKESRKTPKSRSPSESSCQDKNFHSLKHQLSAMKLTLREIPGDGNCLFGALADQLDGTPKTHMKHRQEVVTYMRNHREDFEPFVEDDEPFDKHLSNLAELGTYGGNECIVAFARLNGVKVVIHQLNAPLWQIDGSEGKENAKEIHISYHNGDHYNSVRRTGDCTSNPSNLKLTVKNSNRTEGGTKKKPTKPHYDDGKRLAYYYDDDDECEPFVNCVDGTVACSAENTQDWNLIMERTGCRDLDTIQQYLVANDYDVNETIDSLLNYIIHHHKGEEPTTVTNASGEHNGECRSHHQGREQISVGTYSAGGLAHDRKKTPNEIRQEKLKNSSVILNQNRVGFSPHQIKTLIVSEFELSTSKRKELKKQIRKQQRNDKKRSQAQGENYGDENSCWGSGSDEHSETIIVRDIGCLSI